MFQGAYSAARHLPRVAEYVEHMAYWAAKPTIKSNIGTPSAGCSTGWSLKAYLK
jgi:hypothetical protein